jgi:hypothetical protein
MGIQHGANTQANRLTTPAELSPQSRATRTSQQFREQVMNLAGGSISEFNELMSSDVSTYLLKFEQHLKAQNNGGKSSNYIRS